MSRIRIFMALAAAASIAAGAASAQETIKIGAVQSKTGPYNPIGKQVMAGSRGRINGRTGAWEPNGRFVGDAHHVR
jgi:hypothetical protein